MHSALWNDMELGLASTLSIIDSSITYAYMKKAECQGDLESTEVANLDTSANPRDVTLWMGKASLPLKYYANTGVNKWLQQCIVFCCYFAIFCFCFCFQALEYKQVVADLLRDLRMFTQ